MVRYPSSPYDRRKIPKKQNRQGFPALCSKKKTVKMAQALALLSCCTSEGTCDFMSIKSGLEFLRERQRDTSVIGLRYNSPLTAAKLAFATVQDFSQVRASHWGWCRQRCSNIWQNIPFKNCFGKSYSLPLINFQGREENNKTVERENQEKSKGQSTDNRRPSVMFTSVFPQRTLISVIAFIFSTLKKNTAGLCLFMGNAQLGLSRAQQ